MSNTVLNGCPPPLSKAGVKQVRETAAAATTVTVYPNPNRGVFTISIKTNVKAAYATIQLTGLYGNIVKEIKAPVNTDGSVQAGVSVIGIAAGIYEARCIIGKETGAVKVMIGK